MMIERKKVELDATGIPVGRLATQIVRLLMGKHRANYAPNVDSGDHVRVTNASLMKITGKNKPYQKEYHRHTMYAHGLKTETLQKVMSTNPSEALRRSVSRMLPKNRLRNERMKRLTIKN